MKKIKVKRAVDLATERIRNGILNGEYPAETKLPPERRLAEELGLNRLTLRSALSHLEAEGLVQPRHGQGVMVLDYRNSGSLDLMAWVSDEEALQDLFILRRSFAAEAVALACEKATAADINRLRGQAKRQGDTEDPMQFLEGDLQFTKIIVESGKSLPLSLLFNSLERITRSKPELPIKMLADRKAASSSYKALIALIRNRNPELARRAILGHLNEKDQKTLKSILAK